MTKQYKKEFDNKEIEKIIHLFARWERNNLVITHGLREHIISDTYGLPYTSSGNCAGIWNTNVESVLKSDRQWKFDGLVLSESNEVIAIFTNNEEKEHVELIGQIDSQWK